MTTGNIEIKMKNIWQAILKKDIIKDPDRILELAHGDENNKILHEEEEEFCKWSREVFGFSKGEHKSPIGFHPQAILRLLLTGKGISLKEQAKLKLTLGIS